MAAHNYKYDICSIHEVYPHLPAELGGINLNSRIKADSPIDQALLTQAQGVAEAFKGMKSRCYGHYLYISPAH
jgi:hypothetical protein